MHGKRAPAPAPDARIAALASKQHGVVALAQLKAMGLSANAVEHRLRVRRLHRVHRGVYSVGHPGLNAEGRWLAAVLACGEGAVLSHRSAAALWGLRRADGAGAEVTVVGRTGRRPRQRLRVHRTRALTPREIAVRRRIAVTTPARTLLDLSEVLTRRSVERALDEAERLRIFDLAALRHVIEANAGRRGASVLAAILGEHHAGATLTRSELEERFLALCAAAGVEQPRVNARLGRVEVDFLWPGARLVVETDGRSSHGTRAAFERDRARDAALTAAGYRVVRFTYRQVERDGDGLVGLLQTMLQPRPTSPAG